MDKFKADRPILVVMPENIDALCELIMQDHCVTYREIETSLDISMTSLYKILHEHLVVKKICLICMP